PAMFCAVLAATFVVPRLHVAIWGGGAQQSSTDARVAQFNLGMPKILHNPFGYGIGMGAETLGYAPFGQLTIDTYYISVALEYGVLGFIIYYSMVAFSIYHSGRRVFETRPDLPEPNPLFAPGDRHDQLPGDQVGVQPAGQPPGRLHDAGSGRGPVQQHDRRHGEGPADADQRHAGGERAAAGGRYAVAHTVDLRSRATSSRNSQSPGSRKDARLVGTPQAASGAASKARQASAKASATLTGLTSGIDRIL